LALNPDTTLLVNLFFCAVIVILGLAAYLKTKKGIPLYIAVAFILFGLSHLAGILFMADVLATPLMVLRIIGYLLVIWVLYLCYEGGGGR